MKSKFKSRKFLLALLGGILIVLNDAFEVGIDQATIYAFAGLIATWIGAEAAVDAKRAGSADVPKEQESYH